MILPVVEWLVVLCCYCYSRKAEHGDFLACLFCRRGVVATFTSRRREVADSRGMSKTVQLGFLCDKQFGVHCITALLAGLSTHALLAVQTCCFITSL